MIEDSKRFLRFITPGIIWGVELLLFLFLSEGKVFLSWAEKHIPNIGFGSGVALLLAVGGIGYLFSLLHHALYLGVYRYCNLLFINHKETLETSVQMGRLRLHQLGTTDELPMNLRLTKNGAWRALNAIWHSREKSSDIISGAEPRSETLCDIVHANGAGLVAFLVSVCSWWLLQRLFLYGQPLFEGWWFIPVLLLVTHLAAYILAVRNAEGFIHIVVTMELENFMNQEKRPMRVVVSENDTMTCKCSTIADEATGSDHKS